ncbi:MAG: peptide transporter ATP-binding protein [Microvirga sp.]|jgi:peptide/nickel transport system ATP-binding protein|nr:peptide transporter ATP-binding protein [Microvirga sp.]
MTAPLLSGSRLARVYTSRKGLFGQPVAVRAVDDLSLHIGQGETLGLVGESGSGKSTTGRMVLGMEKPDSGTILFDGEPSPPMNTTAWRRQRARMQMIFQDPLGALDRRLTIATQICEPLDIHNIGAPSERKEQVSTLLRAVGLSTAQGERFPHELSGGQRQRAVLARALATKPDLLVCDEPVSALDVSIQAQVVNLLIDIQAELGLGMLFISHDLRVVRQISQRVAVMYLGRIVEEGDADDLFATPAHPYTRALVSASPMPGQTRADRLVLKGDPPNPAARPSGCAFHPRCPLAIARCGRDQPALVSIGASRRAACHVVAPQTTPETLHDKAV